MRGITYVIAALAAIGIMLVIATSPNPDSQDGVESSSQVSVARAELGSVNPESFGVMTEAGELRINVPGMHCEFACFPKVKGAIEGSEGVENVALAEQKEEGILDNRQVIVSYQPGFDVQVAMASLKAAGYADSALAP